MLRVMTDTARPCIEFWFEFASTYSYPAAMRVERVAAEYGCEVRWVPFLLGPIFRAQGWQDSPFNLYPAKGRYMWRDLERICSELDLPLKRSSVFPRNGLLAARIACAAQAQAWLPAFVRNVYSASFAGDRDIATPAVIEQCLEGLVEDPQHTLRAAEDPTVKAQLRNCGERANELGIFGSPSFVVGDELFWGNDRLENALRWAIQSRSPQARVVPSSTKT
jgi:2-hydroxychromene-2-carboxylate isomerase